tara:strand:- start:923 stop:1186 length:264 start_codon:yes stop_codon:yes gene_type:complete
MATMKHMGSNEMVKRLTAQVGSEKLARSILVSRGHMDKEGNLTKAGKARDAMTAEERAVDRASKRSGKPAAAYKYDPRTNAAKLRKK